MSQEKVERYKKEKAVRKQTMAKEKRNRWLRSTAFSLVLVALVGWFGYSAYNLYATSQPRKVVEVDYTAVSDYISGLQDQE